MEVIRLGSRDSRLAVIQTKLLEAYLVQSVPPCKVEIVTMKTTGDRILDRSLDQVGGKGLFVKELDVALREGRSDLSVHSLKDVPMVVAADIPLLGFSKREDPRDVLVLPQNEKELNPALPIGCSSKRRKLQLAHIFPHMTIRDVRGNVMTRLEKLDRGEFSGLVLAAAGLHRLGLKERISRYFSVTEILPSPGQGILAIQGRTGECYDYLEGFFDQASYYAALGERAFVRTLDGGCSSPLAAHGVIRADQITLTGLYAKEMAAGEYAKRYVVGSVTGAVAQAEELGITLANQLKNGGMGKI